MMCVMHESEEYGYLTVNKNPMNEQQIARIIGEIPSVVSKIIKELESANVFSRREDGAIYSRRMVKDEHIRNVRAKSGKMGGNPNLTHRTDYDEASNGSILLKQTNKQRTTPSSSSSSSEQNLSEAKASSSVRRSTTAERFAEFWATWPTSSRKDAKGKCEQRWRKAGLDAIADRIMAHVTLSKQSDKWLSGYEPSPLRYLSERRWEDGDVVLPGYSERAVELFDTYTRTLFANGWPEATSDVFSNERANQIEQFLSFGNRENWVEAYFGWLAENLEARPGYGFDWVIKRETYIRAREGNFSALKEAA